MNYVKLQKHLIVHCYGESDEGSKAFEYEAVGDSNSKDNQQG